jgi:hypothetical protein
MTLSDISAILDASGAAVAVLGPDARLTYASGAFRERPGMLDAVQRLCPPHEPPWKDYQVLGEGAVRFACRIETLADGRVVVTALGAALQPADQNAAVRLVQAYWGLPPAEAETAWLHARGAGLPAIANTRGVGLETIRTQLRAVRGKTGAATGRALQALFWSVLAGTAPLNTEGTAPDPNSARKATSTATTVCAQR